MPELAPVSSRARRRRLRRRHPRGPRRHPARLPDADLRLRGRLPRPDDPRAQGPRGDRPPAQLAGVRLERAPARRLRARRSTTGTRWTSSRRARSSTTRTRTTRTRRSSGTTTTPTGARRRRSTTASWARTCSTTSARRSSSCRSGEYDVPLVIADHAFNRDGSFRYAENVDLGFRGDTILVNGAVSPRMRVERRIYRLRFLNASNARSYELRLGQRPRGRADRQRRRPARARRRPHRACRCTRPSGSSCSSTSAEFRAGLRARAAQHGGRGEHEEP